jgi:4-hydroxybenzoate polyprenyltransferase
LKVGHELFMAGCFIRGSALGGSCLLALLGVFAADARPPLAVCAAVLAVALCFHVFAYVTNDLVDLEMDRVARPVSPLVTGWVTPRLALVTALVPVPVGVAVAVAAGGWRAGGLVTVAVAAMGVYNLYGKRARVPPLTDAVQGVAWAALVLAASTMAGGRWNALVWAFAAFTVVFILMANGIHGAVRDIVVDSQFGVRSTALVYGARPAPGGGVDFPRPLSRYAAALHAAAFAALWAPVVSGGAGYSRGQAALVAALLVVVTGLSTRWLAAALRAGADERALRSAGMLHLVTLLAVPVVLLVPLLPAGVLAAVALVYLVPLLPHGGVPELLRWARDGASGTVRRLRVGSRA